MSADFQFFTLVTVSVKHQITSWATAQSDRVSLYVHLCFMPFLENAPWQSNSIPFKKIRCTHTDSVTLIW